MKDKILCAAVKIAEKTPLMSVTRGKIAKRSKVAPSLVSFYLGTMEDLRDSIVAAALDAQNLAVIGNAIAARHPRVAKIPDAVRRDALKLFLAA